MSSLYSKGCIALALIVVASPAQADNTTLIRFDGPEIHGQVNTATNTFVVTSWTENPGGSDWWTPAPASLPLHYTALTSSGAVFDVPDNWDGNMAGWAFISDLTNAAIQWNEGTYTFDTTRAHGWGGSRINASTINLFALTNAELFWEDTPVGTNGRGGLSFNVVSTVPEPGCAVMCLIASPLLFSFGRRRTEKTS